jgi:hypothetical protein
MKISKRTSVLGAAAAIALSVVLVGPVSPANAVSTGARYCSAGYDAYTAAGLDGGQALTIIHQQTNAGVTRMSGLYTHGGQTRLWSAGWQSFSSSSVSNWADVYYTGCF